MATKSPKVMEWSGAGSSDAEMKHALSLVAPASAAAAKKCKEQTITVSCKPQLVSCDPVVVVDDCTKVKVVIN